MNTGKLIIMIVAAAVVVGLIGLGIKLIAGLFGLLGSFFNLLLGIAVVLALVIIVVWMFRYAAKNGKK